MSAEGAPSAEGATLGVNIPRSAAPSALISDNCVIPTLRSGLFTVGPSGLPAVSPVGNSEAVRPG